MGIDWLFIFFIFGFERYNIISLVSNRRESDCLIFDCIPNILIVYQIPKSSKTDDYSQLNRKKSSIMKRWLKTTISVYTCIGMLEPRDFFYPVANLFIMYLKRIRVWIVYFVWLGIVCQVKINALVPPLFKWPITG